MAESKRLDVMRNQFPAQTRAANRAIGNDIYCCVNQDGGLTFEDGESVDICTLDDIVVDDTYRRIFLSATIGRPILVSTGDEILFQISVAILERNHGLIMVPSVSSSVEGQPLTITAAVDVGPGVYSFAINMGATQYGTMISSGETSLQAIIGQVVAEPQCFRIPSGSA